MHRFDLLREFVAFLRANRNWWLLPIGFVLVLMGAVMAIAGGSELAPFIYTIFCSVANPPERATLVAAPDDFAHRRGADTEIRSSRIRRNRRP